MEKKKKKKIYKEERENLQGWRSESILKIELNSRALSKEEFHHPIFPHSWRREGGWVMGWEESLNLEIF